MAQATFYCSYGSDRNAALSGDPDDLSIRRLTALLTSLLDEARAPSLPDWTYRTWCLALQYRELNPRAQASTKELASRRDQALSHPEVRLLVEWAGSRRRDNPAVGAAAALTTVRLAQRRSRFASLDVAELGRRVAAEADAARLVRFSPYPCPRSELERDSPTQTGTPQPRKSQLVKRTRGWPQRSASCWPWRERTRTARCRLSKPQSSRPETGGRDTRYRCRHRSTVLACRE